MVLYVSHVCGLGRDIIILCPGTYYQYGGSPFSILNKMRTLERTESKSDSADKILLVAAKFCGVVRCSVFDINDCFLPPTLECPKAVDWLDCVFRL